VIVYDRKGKIARRFADENFTYKDVGKVVQKLLADGR